MPQPVRPGIDPDLARGLVFAIGGALFGIPFGFGLALFLL